MSPNPTPTQTDSPGKRDKPGGQSPRRQKATQPQPAPTNASNGVQSEQDPRVRRSNQAGDQDVDDSADGEEDGRGPDGVR